jgi:hypothetical protein
MSTVRNAPVEAPSQEQEQEQEQALDLPDSSDDNPWDNDNSLHVSDVAPQDDNIGYATCSLSHQGGVWLESTNDAALRFGIRFTTEQFH